MTRPLSGVYRYDAPSGPSNIDRFGEWLGRPVEIATAFTSRDVWSNIEGPAWQLGPWSLWVRARPGRNLSYAVAFFPSGGSLASCAAGTYDSHWRNLANNLSYYGLSSAYLRLGWEMDGSWYWWSAPAGSGKEASFAGCFRRVVQVMRQTYPANKWKFVFNVTDITWPNTAYLAAIWPGDEYVDAVGVDVYDHSWVTNSYPYPDTCNDACRLQRQQNAWSQRSSKLILLRNFAIARGKPLVIPEWGTAIRSDGHGGGDDPYFIQQMYNFIFDPSNKVVFHAYFNVSGMRRNGMDHRLTDAVPGDDPTGVTRFPSSAALFKQLFGPGID